MFWSTSHSATIRVPLTFRSSSMWSLPRPPKPTTANRISPLAPVARETTGTLVLGFALGSAPKAGNRPIEAVVRREDLRKLRRSSLFIGMCNCSLDAAEQALGYRFRTIHFTYSLYQIGKA